MATIDLSIRDNASAAADAVTAALNKVANAASNASASATKVGQTTSAALPAFDALNQKLDEQAGLAAKVDAANQKYATTLQALRVAAQNNADVAAKLSQLEANAAADRDNSIAKATAYAEALKKQRSGLDDVTTSTNGTAYAQRQLQIQAVQAISGIATGQGVMTVLIQQGHQVYDSFQSAGTGLAGFGEAAAGIASKLISLPAVILASVAAIGLMAYNSLTAQNNLASLQNQLSATRTDFIQMGIEATKAAQAVAATTPGVNLSDASKASQTISSSPNFNGTQAQLQSLIVTSNQLAQVMGITLPEAAKEFATALQDPGKEAQELADKHFPGMTQAIANTIKSMADSGEAGKAFTAVQKIIADQVKGASDNISPFSKAVNDLGLAFTKTGSDGKSLWSSIGDAVLDASVIAIHAITGIVTSIEELRQKAAIPVSASNPSNAYANPNLLHPDATGQKVLLGPVQDDGQRAVGIGQVNPQTAAGLGYTAAQIDTTLGNLLASLTYFTQQVTESGSVSAGLGRYNAGPGRYARNPSASDPYIAAVGGQNPNDLPASLTEPLQNATTALTGLIEKAAKAAGVTPDVIISTWDKLLLQESGGRQFGTGGSSALPSGAGSQPHVSSGFSNAERSALGGVGIGSDDGTAAAATLQQQQAVIDQAQKLADSQNLVSTSAQTAKDHIALYTSALAALAQQGTTTGAQVDKFKEGLKASNLELYNAVPALQQLDRQTQATIVANNAVADSYSKGASAAIQANAAEKARQDLLGKVQAGTQEYTVALAHQTAAELAVAQSAGSIDAAKIIAATNQQTDSQNAINAAWDGSAASLTHLQDVQKAQINAQNESLIPGTDAYTKRVNDLTSAYDASAASLQTFQQQQASVQAVSGAFSQAFSTIGDAITQAFVQGQGAAVNWGNIVKSVIAQVIQKVAELAILNPILNSLFGQNNGTLSSALATFAGGGGSTGSGSGLFGTGSSLLSLGNSLSGGSLFGNLGSSLGLTGEGGLFSGATSLLSTGIGTNIAATQAASTVAAGAYGPVLSGGAVIPQTTLGGLLGGVGAGYTAGTLLNSLLGGHELGGQIGSGAGAAAGALAGTFIFPGVGTVLGGIIGGALGGAGGGLIGPGPKNSYSSTALSTQNGLLSVGNTVSQVYDPSADVANLNAEVAALNQALAANNLTISGKNIQIGQNTPGGYQDPTKFASLDSAISSYSISSATDANFNDKFKQAFTDGYGSVQTLVDWINKYNAAQTASAQYIAGTTSTITNLNKTNGSLNDTIAGINSSFQQVIDAGNSIIATNDLSATQTQAVTDSENQLIAARDKSIQAAVDAATAQDAATQSSLETRYLSAQATITGSGADAEAQKLYTFDANYQPQIDQYKASLVALYGDSITTSQGYADDIALIEKTLGQERLAIVSQYNQQIAQQFAGIVQADAQFTSRAVTASQILQGQSNSPIYQEQSALSTFDANAQPQRDAFSKQLTDLYGQIFTTTSAYAAQMAGLENTLGQERLAIQKQYDDQITAAGAAITTADNNLRVRYQNAAATISGNPAQAENAKLYAFDTDAQNQRDALSKQLTDLYGTSYKTTAGYASQMLLLENTLGEERLAIQTQYNQQMVSAASNVISSISSYVTTLQGAASPLSPQAQLALQESTFDKDNAASLGGDFNATSRLTSDATNLLNASKAVFGTGSGYVADYQKVLDALTKVSQTSPDTLTASAFASETQTQTATLVESLAELNTQLVAIKLQLAQGSSAPRQLS